MGDDVTRSETPAHGPGRALLYAAIALAGVVAYANTLPGEFVWDDVSSIVLHEHVQDPTKALQLFREDFHAFGRGQGNFYRPLLAVSFMIEYALARPQPGMEVNPTLFHIGNMAWHIAAALLLFSLLHRLRAPLFVAASVAVIYVVHPVHTEAVAYISGRGDPMAAALMFAALRCALLEGALRTRIIGAVLSGVFFTMAVLSKESAAIYPVLLAVVLLLAPTQAGDRPLRETWRGRLIPFGVGLALVIGYGLVRTTVLQFATESQPLQTTFLGRLWDALAALALYFRVVFVPTGLHMERTLDGIPVWTAYVGLAILAAWILLIVAALRTGRKRIALGGLWFLVTWLPISGLFPLNAPMAEHWLYVPVAGMLLVFVELFAEAMRPPVLRRAAPAVVYFVVIALTALTVDRNLDWRDNESLFRATLAHNPNSTRVHYNLAVTYEVLKDNPAGARRHFGRVLELYAAQKERAGDPSQFWDQEMEAHLSLGRIYLDGQQYDRAARHFQTLLSIAPTERTKPVLARAAVGMGRCLLAVGDAEQANRIFEQAVEWDPSLRGSGPGAAAERATTHTG